MGKQTKEVEIVSTPIADGRMTEEEKTKFFTAVKNDVRGTLYAVGQKVMDYAASVGQQHNANLISYMLKQWRKILSQYADDNRPPKPKVPKSI